MSVCERLSTTLSTRMLEFIPALSTTGGAVKTCNAICWIGGHGPGYGHPHGSLFVRLLKTTTATTTLGNLQ